MEVSKCWSFGFFSRKWDLAEGQMVGVTILQTNYWIYEVEDRWDELLCFPEVSYWVKTLAGRCCSINYLMKHIQKEVIAAFFRVIKSIWNENNMLLFNVAVRNQGFSLTFLEHIIQCINAIYFCLCQKSYIVRLLVMFTHLIYNKLKMDILLHVFSLYSCWWFPKAVWHIQCDHYVWITP